MRYLIFFLLMVAVWSCTSSPEDKANKLIKKDLITSLYKPDTYKPVETKIDSAFSPDDSPEIFLKMQEMYEISGKAIQEENDLEDAESSMAIWGGPYSSSLGQHEYKQAKKKYDQAKNNLDNYKRKAQKKLFEIIEMFQKKKTFCGWKVAHNYRADNNAGQTLIGNKMFIIDKNFEKILYSIDLETFQNLAESSADIREQSAEFRKILKEKGITTKDVQNSIDSLLDIGYTFEQIQEIGYGNLK